MKYQLNTPSPPIPTPAAARHPQLTVADLIARLERIEDSTRLVYVGGMTGELLFVDEEEDGKVWLC